jgi:hypothetical protein
MKKIYFCITPVLVILILQGTSAQTPENRASITPWEIGISGGFSLFLTSVNPEASGTRNRINYWNQNLNPGLGVSLTRNFSPFWGVELNWLNTRLSGTWNNEWPLPSYSQRYGTPFTFDAQINQFDFMIAFNANQTLIPDVEEDPWHLFLKPGIGFTQIKDTKKFYPDGSSYIRFSAVIDAGLSVSLSAQIKLMLGSTFRLVNTDNLDGVHVIPALINGNTRNYMKVFEIYNFNYLRLSYCFGHRNDKGGFGLGF